jgi:hypothetical protein
MVAGRGKELKTRDRGTEKVLTSSGILLFSSSFFGAKFYIKREVSEIPECFVLHCPLYFSLYSAKW